jgi:NADH dehydrogenase [ubiquinone] 1 alpha subcomplex assembly factor 1
MHLRYVLLLCLASLPWTAAAEDRLLFSFDTPEAAQGWQAVNDGVMGGRSDGRFRMTDGGLMEFFGTLSLENNGGFASVRTMGRPLGLNAGDVIVARVRGDGREYTFNVYAGGNRNGYSYRQSFTTKKDEWIDVVFPMDLFTATWRGRVFPNEKLKPAAVTGMGFLLGDKKPGPFKLEVDSIRVGTPQAETQRDLSLREGKSS